MENIHASANRAAQAVRQLRKLAGQKAEEPTRTSIDLNQLVQQAAVRIKPAWKAPSGESINFAIHCTPIPHILGEVFAISELLNALLANAVAAMPAGGCITISTAADNQFVRLQVSDTRTVMTATVHQNCFEPVFTPTDMPRSGLDLAMAYGIVKRHGGTIAMDSQPDHGTTITLRLPIPPGPATTTGAGRSSS